MVPPLPIPNREVKRRSADDSPYGAKVGSRRNREFNQREPPARAVFLFLIMVNLLLLMASWSTKRKYGYFLLVIAFVVAAIAIPFFSFFYKAPNCFDKKQNGNERGVDCGGVCIRLCPADYAMPKVIWAYASKVVPKIYNLLAYVQNPNQSVEAKSVGYVFRMYDDRGILISQKEGATFVPAGQKFAVFENAIQTGDRIPTLTTFEFTTIPEWRLGTIFTTVRLLSIDLEQGSSPSAEIKIKNDTVDKTILGMTAYIVLYDKDDNRVNFSKTVVDRILPGEQKSLYFTWPEAFPKEIVRSEAIFVANPR